MLEVESTPGHGATDYTSRNRTRNHQVFSATTR